MLSTKLKSLLLKMAGQGSKKMNEGNKPIKNRHEGFRNLNKEFHVKIEIQGKLKSFEIRSPIDQAN